VTKALSLKASCRDVLDFSFFPTLADHPAVEWRVESDFVDYDKAVAFMLDRTEKIRQGIEREMVWLIEHPPLYTAGTSAKRQDLLKSDFLPVFLTGRGGEYTYHGPGQRVVYVMLDLKARRADVRAFVGALEEWIIRTLKFFDIMAERREDRVGVWVTYPDKTREDKIAAIGIRLKKWVSLHGVSINIAPDLTHYDGIIPCGLENYGITSFLELGLPVTMAQFDAQLKRNFQKIFGDNIIKSA